MSDLAAIRHRAAAGQWAEVRERLRARDDGELSPELATLRAEAELRTGNARDARLFLAGAIPMLERSGDRAALRRAINQLGVAEVELGALDDAERAFARALELGRDDDDDLLIARATNNLGAIADIRGRRDDALALYQLAIPAYQRLGNTAGLAESMHNMAISYRDLGQLERADEHEQRAIVFALESGNGALAALARLGRAEIASRAGDHALAEVGARRAASEFAALPDPIREATALRLLGATRLALHRLESARDALERGLELARAQGSRLVEGETLRLRAELEAIEEDRERAWATIAEAIGIFELLGATTERDDARAWAARMLASS